MLSSQEKLQYIKAKVVEVCPEVMDIKDGCILERNTGLQYKITDVMPNNGNITLRGIYTPSHLNPHIVDGKFFVTTKTDWPFDFKNIGHPITLSHILRTIGTPEQTDKNPDDTYELLGGYKHSWNMIKDNLNDQSEATIDFLYQFIK